MSFLLYISLSYVSITLTSDRTTLKSRHRNRTSVNEACDSHYEHALCLRIIPHECRGLHVTHHDSVQPVSPPVCSKSAFLFCLFVRLWRRLFLLLISLFDCQFVLLSARLLWCDAHLTSSCDWRLVSPDKAETPFSHPRCKKSHFVAYLLFPSNLCGYIRHLKFNCLRNTNLAVMYIRLMSKCT
jgi:hypothetical protein